MKWFALLVLILFLGTIAIPSINASIIEQVEEEIVDDTIIEWEKQKQRFIEIISGIINYFERIYSPLPDEDCGCEEQVFTSWPFPFICLLLYPPFMVLATINIFFVLIFGIPLFGDIVERILDIADTLNCRWNYWQYQ